MNDNYNKLRTELDSNIPAEAVEQREAWRGGPKLSYLSGAYVIDRLNQVLGQGKWGYTIRSLTPVFEGEIEQSNGTAFTTSYIATIQLMAFIEGNTTHFDEVGYGDGTDKKSKGKAHELATKEAITDALKRAAKNLGRSMGLGLYFKSGEYIEDAETVKTEIKEEVKQPIKRATETAKQATPANPETLRKTIQQAFKVLQAQRRIDKETFIKDYLSGGKTSDLSDDQVKVTITKLKLNFPDVIL